MVEPRDFMAIHARDENIISRVIGRVSRLEAHFIGDAPAAQVLDGSRIREIRRRKLDAAVSLLDDQTRDAVIGELDR
jgi:hypothetical protein